MAMGGVGSGCKGRAGGWQWWPGRMEESTAGREPLSLTILEANDAVSSLPLASRTDQPLGDRGNRVTSPLKVQAGPAAVVAATAAIAIATQLEPLRRHTALLCTALLGAPPFHTLRFFALPFSVCHSRSLPCPSRFAALSATHPFLMRGGVPSHSCAGSFEPGPFHSLCWVPSMYWAPKP